MRGLWSIAKTKEEESAAEGEGGKGGRGLRGGALLLSLFLRSLSRRRYGGHHGSTAQETGRRPRAARGRGLFPFFPFSLPFLFLRSPFYPSIRRAPRLNGSGDRQKAKGCEGQGRGLRGINPLVARRSLLRCKDNKKSRNIEKSAIFFCLLSEKRPPNIQTYGLIHIDAQPFAYYTRSLLCTIREALYI